MIRNFYYAASFFYIDFVFFISEILIESKALEVQANNVPGRELPDPRTSRRRFGWRRLTTGTPSLVIIVWGLFSLLHRRRPIWTRLCGLYPRKQWKTRVLAISLEWGKSFLADMSVQVGTNRFPECCPVWWPDPPVRSIDIVLLRVVRFFANGFFSRLFMDGDESNSDGVGL